MRPLVLASASPRRRELLERAGVPFEVAPAEIDESALPGEAPEVYVLRIARAKAEACARTDAVILAADTTVTVDGAILAKAESEAEACAMLARLSGRTHRVLTAFVVRTGTTREERVVATEIDMIAFDPAAYVASGEWRGKAGAYAIQGVGAALVRAVRGSVTNVIGLPLVEVLEALRAHGIAPDLAAGRPA